MAQTTTTTTTDVYIPTLDELDRMAQTTTTTRLSKLDPQTRLAARLDAHRELVQRHEAAAQGVRS